MQPKSFLNPQGAWSNLTSYSIGLITGSADIGLGYLNVPLVNDAGGLWYLNNTVAPTLATHPANDAAWSLLQAGTVIKTAAPTSSDDKADGYAVGTLWVNSNNGDVYLCTANTVSSAVWTAFAGNA